MIEAAGGRALAVSTDVTDRAAVERLVRETEAQFGPIDLLVNNAGDLTVAAIWQADPDEWWRCVTVNLQGTFLCTRAVLNGMIARRRGRIINVVSASAYGRIPNVSAYSSSKAGLVRFTSSLAAETQEHGLATFAVDPGNVDTAMWEYTRRVDSPEWHRWRAANPGLTFIPPERAGRLVAALASGRADALSGRVISVADDLDELVRRADEIVQDDLYMVRRRT